MTACRKSEYKGIGYMLSSMNCKIIDSWRVTSRKEMRSFCESVLPDYFFSFRTLGSYIREWRAHNLLYSLGYETERTKDTDLDPTESELRKFGYFFLSILYAFFKGRRKESDEKSV